LVNNKLLEDIYNSKISEESKLLMF
jgi:hypothetical protein